MINFNVKFEEDAQKFNLNKGFGEAIILSGKDGEDGTTPHIGENGNWWIGDEDTGKPSRGETGLPGKDGKDGADGYTPQKGIDYFDGQPGKDGTNGKDGYTPVKGVDYFDGVDGSPGKDGADGQPGADGKDGVSVTHKWNGTVLNITSASGTSSADLKGEKGDRGEKGESGGIDVTGAEVGQIIKVSAVDGNGKPTAWEAVDMPKSAQADWNQNDETAADYVKNRPFYTEVEEKVVEYTPDSDCILDGFPAFEVGDTVTVKIDGVEHSLVAFNGGGAVVGDDPEMFFSGSGELGWFIGVTDSEVWFYAYEPHTVSYQAEIVHALDEKYLGFSLNFNFAFYPSNFELIRTTDELGKVIKLSGGDVSEIFNGRQAKVEYFVGGAATMFYGACLQNFGDGWAHYFGPSAVMGSMVFDNEVYVIDDAAYTDFLDYFGLT